MAHNGKTRRVEERSISNLPALVSALSSVDRARFDRLFHVSRSVGELVPPESMHAWITGHFGSVTAVERQVIVKTTNRVTMEGTLFNALRASRPFESEHSSDIDALVSEGVGDPFCTPLTGTPADVFGRVEGKRAITAANVAKYDAFHSVVVFDEHNPLHFDEASVSDAMDVGLEWAHRVLDLDPEAKYFFFMWNCLWKSGASILHGHAQVAATHDMHYAKIEGLRRQALEYRDRSGSGYFDDLVAVHRSLGLAVDAPGATIISSLTPIKEKETLIIGDRLDANVERAAARVLEQFVHHLGVTSFNLVVYLPPLAASEEDWSGFPCMVRIVDRGVPTNKTADIGAMELYAASVVSSDPFRVADALKGLARTGGVQRLQ
ncbi:MAG TPA: hypothetical protein VFC51_13780 [Chloroflexota bacterium]|nr:hypothetical protein [Chloroflexota bacterium]